MGELCVDSRMGLTVFEKRGKGLGNSVVIAVCLGGIYKLWERIN